MVCSGSWQLGLVEAGWELALAWQLQQKAILGPWLDSGCLANGLVVLVSRPRETMIGLDIKWPLANSQGHVKHI